LTTHRKALAYLNTNGFEDDAIIHRGIDSQNFFGFSILSNFFRELLTAPNGMHVCSGLHCRHHGLHELWRIIVSCSQI